MAVPFYMAGMEICMNKKKKKFVSYAKWGYIFLIPFFAVYIVFSLIPLISTFYNSFFENYMVGLMRSDLSSLDLTITRPYCLTVIHCSI